MKPRTKKTNTKRGKLLGTLFLRFFKTGLFTFGGGYAMIALLESEFIDRQKWLSKEEFLDMVALAESTPGPIAINSATYIGYKVAGVPGAAAATLGVCLPSLLIIYLISLFFDRFLALPYVAYAFRGIQVCVTYLILSAGLKMLRASEKTWLSYVLLGITMVAMIGFYWGSVSFSSIFFILIGGAVGVFFYLLKKIRRDRHTSTGEDTSSSAKKEEIKRP